MPIKVASGRVPDDACLCLVNDVLVSVLVRLEESFRGSEAPWYLEMGFGPCTGEGIIFPTLEDAREWALTKVQGTARVEPRRVGS